MAKYKYTVIKICVQEDIKTFDSSVEYTAQQFKSLKNDIDSIWYINQEVLI